MYVCCPDLSPPKPLEQSKNVTVRTYHKFSMDKIGQKVPKRANIRSAVYYLVNNTFIKSPFSPTSKTSRIGKKYTGCDLSTTYL